MITLLRKVQEPTLKSNFSPNKLFKTKKIGYNVNLKILKIRCKLTEFSHASYSKITKLG